MRGVWPAPLPLLLLLRLLLLVLPPAAAVGQECADPTASTTCLLNLASYDRKAPPPGFVEVTLSATVTKVNKLDTMLQSFQVFMYFRQEWTDSRLRWNVTGEEPAELLFNDPSDVFWNPDTFFSKGLAKRHNDHEQFFALRHNGGIVWSQRLTLQMICQMSFSYYPFDVQHCHTSVESYGFPSSKLSFRPAGDGDRYVALELDKNEATVDLVGSYTVSSLRALQVRKLYGPTVFVGVEWWFELRRGRWVYVLSTFLPLWLVVLLAALGPFINPEAVPARVGLGITTVLVLISLMFILTRHLPESATPSAIDVYVVMCFLFVTAYCVEYAFVNYVLTKLAQRDRQLKEKEALFSSFFRVMAEAETTPQWFSSKPKDAGASQQLPGAPDGEAIASPKGTQTASPKELNKMHDLLSDGGQPPLQRRTTSEYVRRRKQLTAAQTAELQSAFAACDSDNSGSISRDDIKPLLKAMNCDNDLINQLFEEFCDADGTLGFEGFVDMMSELQEITGATVFSATQTRAVSVCCGMLGATRLSIDALEKRFRRTAPACFVAMNVVWFTVVLASSG